MSEQNQSGASTQESVEPATGKLVVSWAVVLIPLAYGVFNTIMDSIPLFT